MEGNQLITFLAVEIFSMENKQLGKVDIGFDGEGKEQTNASCATKTDYR